MEARNKKIEDGFGVVTQGQIVLPRFQRHESWRPSQIAGLLENIDIGRRSRNDTACLAKLFEMYTKMTATEGKAA